MTAAVLLSACLGIALGLQFRVLVMVPAAVLAAAATVLLGYSSGLAPAALIGPVIAAIVTVQLGYVCGGMGRAFLGSLPLEAAGMRLSRPPRRYRSARQ